MLNQALASSSYPKLPELLLSEPTFLGSLIRLLEHHSIVIRGKALLTFLLLFRSNFRWLAIVDPEVKFFHVLDRLARDNYKYVQCCLQCLTEGIVELLPVVFQAISEELQIVLNGGRSGCLQNEFDRRVNTRTEFETLHGGNLIYIAIILDLMAASTLKQRLVNAPFIQSIATLIDNTEIFAFQGAEEFLNALLLIVENMSSQQKVLLQMSESVVSVMLPVLLVKTKSESADIRFLSLKIFTDIIIQYINDDSIYNALTEETESDTTKQISDLLCTQLFPCFIYIL